MGLASSRRFESRYFVDFEVYQVEASGVKYQNLLFVSCDGERVASWLPDFVELLVRLPGLVLKVVLLEL